MTDLFRIGLRGESLPTISVSQDLLRKFVERVGRTHNIEDLAFRLPLMGTDIDSCDEETLEIEIFPDRPDLLSPETLFHGMIPFLHDYPPKPRLNIQPGTISMTVSKDLKEIRPIILGAVVRGVSIDGDVIKRLMDHQEKLHFALGRGRKRASIGVHDLAKIAPPFRVEAVSRDYKFTPLLEQKICRFLKFLQTIRRVWTTHIYLQEWIKFLSSWMPTILCCLFHLLSMETTPQLQHQQEIYSSMSQDWTLEHVNRR